MRRPCDYSDPSPAADDSAHLQSRILQLEQLVVQLSNQTPSISPGYEATVTAPITDNDSSSLYSKSLFLDSGLSEYCSIPDSAVSVSIPQEVSTSTGDRLAVDQMKSQYFRSVNTWMPIVNEAKLNRALDYATQSGPRADCALLLLSMKLILDVPMNGDAGRSRLYTITKQFCSTLETEGLYSLTKLQASLIIAVYELGHAIFPAAYTSIGTCARQGVALGLHNRKAPQMLQKPRSWVDWEERLRVWWLVVILDRFGTAFPLGDWF